LANPANAINSALYPKLSYDFLADFSPIVNVVSSPLIMMVHPSLPVRTPDEFIAYAKAQPDKVNLASGGNAGIGHLAAELFKMRTGIQFVHVPYRGEALAVTDLISGQAQLLFATTGSAMMHVKAGTVRPLAVTTKARLPGLPEIPSLDETLSGYEVSAWGGLVAPRNTPAKIVEKINYEVGTALADSGIRQRINELGATPVGGTSTAFAKFMADEAEKFSKIVKFAGLKPT
jgi:tripartite-type tricarboxylate transporter receptor subunit TctC